MQSPSHLFITASDGEAVVGALSDSEIAVDVDFPSGDQELDRFVAEHPGARFLFGRFPGREDDGERAVTLTLPDADGTVRAHPH